MKRPAGLSADLGFAKSAIPRKKTKIVFHQQILTKVKPELTTTAEKGPRAYKDYHFEVPFGTFKT
jgi:hypothetical protein